MRVSAYGRYAAPASAAARRTHGRRILVSGGADVSSAIICRLAGALNFAAEPVPEHTPTLSAIAQRGPDIVVLDCSTDMAWAARTLEHIRDIYDARELPVIAVLASSSPEGVAQFLHAGANDYLIRPVTLDALWMGIVHNLPEESVGDRGFDERVRAQRQGAPQWPNHAYASP